MKQKTAVQMELKKTENPRRMQKERKGLARSSVFQLGLCCVDRGRAGCSCNGRSPSAVAVETITRVHH